VSSKAEDVQVRQGVVGMASKQCKRHALRESAQRAAQNRQATSAGAHWDAVCRCMWLCCACYATPRCARTAHLAAAVVAALALQHLPLCVSFGAARAVLPLCSCEIKEPG
jgi:membrane protease subunit (stomatin/prohibitin family)